MQLGLKRPQQKSYPHLDGLYLLLRGTGLTRLEADGPKSRLILDETALSSWAELSFTEQYFTLLESWLLRADPCVLGDREGLFRYDHPIYSWSHFFKQISDQGLIIAGNKAAEEDLRFWPKLRNLALLELFGFATVQPNPPKPQAGWQIGRIWRTPLGEAMLELLQETIASNIYSLILAQDVAYIPFGTLQPVIQPYFSEWQQNLIIPVSQFQPGLHILKVSLGKNLWRKIAVPGDTPLDFLAHAILDAYEFDHDHLDRFTYTDRFGVPRNVNHPYLEDPPSTEEVRVGNLQLTPGDTMTYLFDFGDSWLFEVLLERIDAPDAEIASPVVLESRGKAPEQYPAWDEW